MQQQTVTLPLHFQLFGREPGLYLAPAPVCRLDLRFDRFTFPAPCHVLLYVSVHLANQRGSLVSARRRSPTGSRGVAPKRKGRTLLAFIAFQAANLLPAMGARDDASAQRHRITRGVIRHRQVMFRALGYELHICHQPNLMGPLLATATLGRKY